MAAIDRPPVERALLRSSGIVVALLLAVAGLSVGGVAISKAANVGQCINDNLGDRNVTQAKDAAAHVEFAKALNDALKATPGPLQQAAVQRFQKVADSYQKTLQDDQTYRSEHPLGQC